MPAVGPAPRVSIVVPVFNAAPYLRRSLESILAQTYRDFEVIVTDDASTDATPEIIASYGSQLRCYRQPTNRGNYGNINDGVARARGAYIAVYHADDVYHPCIVEREVAFLERHADAGAVFCQSLLIDPAGDAYARRDLPVELRGGRPLPFDSIVDALLTHMNRFLPCPSVMMRAAVWRDVGPFRDQYGGTADLDLWLRIARHSPLGILEEYLLAYRVGHDNNARRAHSSRTQPRRYFEIMHRCLDDGDGASPAALRAFEAHRTRDTLVLAIHRYMAGEQRAARLLLRDVRAALLPQYVPSPRRSWLIWLLVLRLLARLPGNSAAAPMVRRRWGLGTLASPRGRRRLSLPMSGANWNEEAAALPSL